MSKIKRLLQLIDLLYPPGRTKKSCAKTLGVTERTIERDLIKLSEIDIHNDKDEAGRFYIFPDMVNGIKVHLTTGEADFISDLMAHTQPNHPLTSSIQTKLFFRSGIGKWLSDGIKRNVSKVVTDLTDAMKMKCQIEILDYYSAYQGKLITRIVEPLSFTINYRYLIAFEANQNLFVNIKIDRITRINILDKKCTKSPNDANVDIFQMAFNKGRHRVCLLLTSLAYRILAEERPGADDLIEPHEAGKFKFKFTAEIANFLPIARFCMGLPGEVKVLESDDLLKVLKSRKEKFLW